MLSALPPPRALDHEESPAEILQLTASATVENNPDVHT